MDLSGSIQPYIQDKQPPKLPFANKTVTAVERFKEQAKLVIPTEEETIWLNDISLFNPDRSRSGELILWSRALRTYGTPLDFVRNIKIIQDYIEIFGQTVPTSYVLNKGHALRSQLITAQAAYPFKSLPTEYDDTLKLGQQGCKLCENIAQAIDTEANVVIDLGDSYLLPNRYPEVPMHSLWIPKSHDDDSRRVTTLLAENGKFVLPTAPGLTRANILTCDQLTTVFELCDLMDLIAIRNHVLDGMSIPGHDHFHIIPKQKLPDGHLGNLLKGIKSISNPFVAELDSVPYSLLAVKSNCGAHETAKIVAPILESLEKKGVVFTLSYIDGTAIISPRDIQAMSSNERLSLGGGPPIASFNPKTDTQIANDFLPVRGQFDWRQIIDTTEEPIHLPFKVEHTFRPLPVIADRWTPGELISGYLTPFERKIWNECFKYQDKRNDFGHAEIVTYLTIQNAKIQGLDSSDRQVAVLAAILHDTGWAFIENISERFSLSLQNKDDELILRKLHQQHSVKITKEILKEYPRLDDVIRIIQEHDTRENPQEVDTITACMWDADILWRVTPWGIKIGKTQSKSIDSDPANWLKLGRKALHLQSSIEIGTHLLSSDS